MSGRRLTSISVRALYITLLTLPSAAVAGDSKPSIDPWLGATLGGLIGSTIGNSESRTAATVAGTIIGYHLASDSSREISRRQQRDIVSRCRAEVPSKYARNDSVKGAWIRGCIDREIAAQLDLEQKAYDDGRNSGELQ
jgi:uncharacterized protein YcfJ